MSYPFEVHFNSTHRANCLNSYHLLSSEASCPEMSVKASYRTDCHRSMCLDQSYHLWRVLHAANGWIACYSIATVVEFADYCYYSTVADCWHASSTLAESVLDLHCYSN